MGKKVRWALLILSLLLLAGCARQQEPAPAPSPTPEHLELPAIQGEGALSEAARRVMQPYEEQLRKVAERSVENLSFTIPGSMLNLLVQDAEAAGAEPREGYYRFSWRQGGRFAYEATVDDAPEIESVTPDPRDEAPMDHQLNGDYAVAGGGLFERVRSYNVAEGLTGGQMEISDSLNGEVTGHEYFSFSVRGDQFYFVDATLNITINKDGEETEEGFLVAAGVLRPDSLEILEYAAANPAQFPDPATMDWGRFAAGVQPVSRVSAQGDAVTLAP